MERSRRGHVPITESYNGFWMVFASLLAESKHYENKVQDKAFKYIATSEVEVRIDRSGRLSIAGYWAECSCYNLKPFWTIAVGDVVSKVHKNQTTLLLG